MLQRKSPAPHPLSPKRLHEINQELITRDIVVPVLTLHQQQQVPKLQSQLSPPQTPEQRPIQKVVFREDAKSPFKSKPDRWDHTL
jgi:hypothetical protein